MGFYFRKSKNFGGIRLNFSKSGLGVSTGVKGARLIFSPNGTYVHLGAQGIYYKKKIGGNDISKHNTNSPKGEKYEFKESTFGETKIETTNFENLTDIDSQEFINELERKNNILSLTPIASIFFTGILVTYCFYYFYPILHLSVFSEVPTLNRMAGTTLLLLLIVLLVFMIKQAKKIDSKRKSIEIYYDLDEAANEVYSKFLDGFYSFVQVKKKWQIDLKSSTSKSKYHGGANTLINRIPLKRTFTHKLPNRYFVTNAKIPFISLRNVDLYFFPERLILVQGRKIAAIMYKNLNVDVCNTQFVENGQVPSDAKVVSYTWQFVNKSGEPDKRFNNNRKLPICSYTDYSFSSSGGINEVISTSKNGGMNTFVDALYQISDLQKSYEKRLTKEHSKKHVKDSYDNVYTAYTKNLINNKPKNWEILLTRELINIILGDLKEKNRFLNNIVATKLMSDLDFLSLINTDFPEDKRKQFSDLISNQLVKAYGKLGEEANAKQIATAIFDVHDCCIQMINWEADIRSAFTENKKINELKNVLVGYSSSYISALEDLLNSLNKYIGSNCEGDLDLNIKIKVSSNMAKYMS